MPPTPARPLWQGRSLAVIGIVLFAFSLRSAVASLSPLIDHITVDFAMPAAIIGLIGTAPPVCYAVFGILTPLFERRLGLERLTVISIVVVTVGMVLRGFATDSVALLLGTSLIFAAVGVGNILLPPLVRNYFPDRIGLMTTIYSTTMAVASFTPPLVAVPVADASSWRFSLGMWAVFAGGRAHPVDRDARARAGASGRRGDRDRPTRRCSGACGGCRSRGRSRSASSPPARSRTRRSRGCRSCWSTPPASRPPPPARCSRCSPRWGCRHPCSCPSWSRGTTRPACCSASRSTTGLAGIAGLLFAPQAAPWLWVALLGLEPLLFPLTLVLLGLRTRTHEGSVALSGFVQSIGYAIVALFPVGIGLLHGATGSWTGPLLVLAAVVVAAIPAGVVVSRRATIEDEWERRHGAW